jgi:hypothetical protein
MTIRFYEPKLPATSSETTNKMGGVITPVTPPVIATPIPQPK